MNEVTKIIKHLMFTAYVEVPDPNAPGGVSYRERLYRLGDEASDLRPEDIARGERPDIDAFYTDAEAEQIRNGTYRGADAETLYAARRGQRPVPLILPAEGEHGDVQSMDAAELAAYFAENKMKVDDILALLPEDADDETIQKFIDAENIASGNDPRSTLIDPLEKRLVAD